MRRLFITCFFVTVLAFPAFLAAQEQPLDEETQKRWDAHTVVPKTDDIQKLRDFLQNGSDNGMQMHERIHCGKMRERFDTAKNKATFEAADRMLELVKKNPKTEQKKEGDSKPQAGIESFIAGPHDSDSVFALKHKIDTFQNLSYYDPQWEQKMNSFIETLEKDPTKMELIFRAKFMRFYLRSVGVVFSGLQGDKLLKKHQENFADLKNFLDHNAADEPFLDIYLGSLFMGIHQAESHEKILRIKIGTLAKPELEYYRSLYEKYVPDNTAALTAMDLKLDGYTILTADDPFAVFQAKVEELKKNMETKLDESSIQKVFGFLLFAEEKMEKHAEAKRLLLTTVCPIFSGSQNKIARAEARTLELMLKHLDLEGQEFEFEAVLMDGTKIDIKDYRGKVVILDYWATWCGPCVAEFPALETFYEDWHENGVELIGLSVDEDMDALKEFLKKEKPTWPIASTMLSKEKNLADSMEKYEINAFPTTILIDQNGKVARAGNGLNSVVLEARKLLLPKEEKK